MNPRGEINMAITILAAILDLCLRKTRADKSLDYRDIIVFEKLRFQIPPFSRAFSKTSVFGGQFLGISVDGRSNWRNKAPFLNSSGVVWTGPDIYLLKLINNSLR